MTADGERIARLRERLWHALSRVPRVELNGHPTRRAPGILNVTVGGVEGESLLFGLDDIALSSGSACATTSGEPSYVLRALGRTDQQAQLAAAEPRLGSRLNATSIMQRSGCARRSERLRALHPESGGRAA